MHIVITRHNCYKCKVMICFIAIIMFAVFLSDVYLFNHNVRHKKSDYIEPVHGGECISPVGSANKLFTTKDAAYPINNKTFKKPNMKNSVSSDRSMTTGSITRIPNRLSNEGSASVLFKVILTICVLSISSTAYLATISRRMNKQIKNHRDEDLKLRTAVSHVAELVFEFRFSDKTVLILNTHPFINRIPLGNKQMTLDGWNNLLHPDDSEMMVSLCERMNSGETVVSAMMRLKSLDDNDEDGYHWYQLTFTCIFDKNYKPIYSIGTLEDIANQKLLQNQAQCDPLTGVLNRNEFVKRMESELHISKTNDETEGISALLMLDLDDFKSINDTSSHIYGDKVLQALTYQLHQVFRTTDIIGRLGGDEFLVFLKDMPSIDLVTKKIEELQIALNLGDGKEVTDPISLSIGVVFSTSGDCFNDLYRKADVALYLAKERGKNQFVIYDS